MFVAEIAFLIEIGLIAWGLIIFGSAETKDNQYRKWAGIILVTGSVITLFCTLYFSLKYMGEGAFDQALLLSSAFA